MATTKFNLGLILLVLLMAFVPAAALQETAEAQTPPTITFTKTFLNDPVLSGNTVTLQYTLSITSNDAQDHTASGLSFTDDLDAALTGLASTTSDQIDMCGRNSVLSGTSTIVLTDATLDTAGTTGPQSCTFSVTLQVPGAAAAGTYPTTTTDLGGLIDGSTAITPGITATDSLVVQAPFMGFTKTFTPATAEAGDIVKVTYNLDNSANAFQIHNLSFSDDFSSVFPDAEIFGVPLADPCGADGALVVQASTVSTVYVPSGLQSLNANTTCTFDVWLSIPGLTAADTYASKSSVLTSASGSTPGASANLTVSSPGTLSIDKNFTDDPGIPGGTLALEYTIMNRNRDPVSAISFTDDLDSVITGMALTGAPPTDPCGSGSTISGTGALTLSGGSLASGDSCTFSVSVQIPGGASRGSYTSQTGYVSGSMGAGNRATDMFTLIGLSISQSFTTNPVGSGSTATLEFTITNDEPTFAQDIGFTLNVTNAINGAIPAFSTTSDACGGGSSVSRIALDIDVWGVRLTGGNLAASGGTCTFSHDITIPAGIQPGPYTFTTGFPQVTLGVDTFNLAPPSAVLDVVGGLGYGMTFNPAAALAGDTVDLEFTITNQDESYAANSIAFTNNLDAALSGLVAIGLPLSDICGVGSSLSGTSTLTFTGGALPASSGEEGSSCTFAVTLQIPASASSGTYTNTASSITADYSGIAVTGSAPSTSLVIADLNFTKSFNDDPVIPGDTVTLEYTIENLGSGDATGMFFNDNFNLGGGVILSVAASLPSEPCGAGSVVNGTTSLIFNGGNLLANTSCTFSVLLQVPGGATDGPYGSSSSNLIATVSGVGVAIPAATDTLSIDSKRLLFSKSFTDDPVFPDNPMTLEYTLTNLDAARIASAITFTDDLEGVLSGLVAVGLPADPCGAGSTLTGTSLLTLTGGSLNGGQSCTFSVTLQVPASASAGNYASTTSVASGTIAALSVAGDPAGDSFIVNTLKFSKAFSQGYAFPGDTVDLTFTIENIDSTLSYSQVAFYDDLDTLMAGLVATAWSDNGNCGSGSQFKGSGFLTFTAGEIAESAVCTLTATLQIPLDAVPSAYLNATSDLSVAGLTYSSPAMDTLVIPGVLVTPDTAQSINEGSTLDFTMSLASPPAATVNFGVWVTDTFQCTVSVSSIYLNGSNWDTGVVVTVSATDDGLIDGDLPCNLITTNPISADPAYDVLTANDTANVNITIVDNGTGTPTNTNITSNGGFDSGATGWTFWGDIVWSINNGMLQFHRTPGWNVATAYQTINISLPAGVPIEITAELGNSSAVPRGVEVMLRDVGWKAIITCSFTIPPNTALQPVVIQGRMSTSLTNVLVAFRAFNPDGIGSILVDNVSAQARPTLNVNGLNCSGFPVTANVELLNNGGFTSGRQYWVLWGDFQFTLNSGVLEFYRTSGATRLAVALTEASYHLPSAAEIQVSLDLGNSSAGPKKVEVFVRDTLWAQNFRCDFTIPANQPLTTVTIKGTTTKQWSRPVLMVRATDADGIPAVLIDNVSIQYVPGLLTTPKCDGSALSAGGLALSLPESTPEPGGVPVTVLPATDPPPPAATDPAAANPLAIDPPPAPAPTDPPANNDPPAAANDPAPATVPTDPPAPPALPGSAYTLADLEAALACVTHGGASQALVSHLDDLPQFQILLDTHTANGNIGAACSDVIQEVLDALMD